MVRRLDLSHEVKATGNKSSYLGYPYVMSLERVPTPKYKGLAEVTAIIIPGLAGILAGK